MAKRGVGGVSRTDTTAAATAVAAAAEATRRHRCLHSGAAYAAALTKAPAAANIPPRGAHKRWKGRR